MSRLKCRSSHLRDVAKSSRKYFWKKKSVPENILAGKTVPENILAGKTRF
jgi:hypothetical protein